LAANEINGVGELGFDVVAVNGDLAVGKLLQGAGQKRLAHVLADLADLGAVSTVGFEV
jgi:hypothetical protein